MTAPTLTLERLLCSSSGFGLTTASPLQRAVCRIVDGLPLGELAEDVTVRAAVGDVDALPLERPAEVYLLAAIRSAKSMLAAATALRASQDCDLSKLGPGETARVSVLSLTVDLGAVVFGHLVGTVRARPALRALMIGEPTADAIMLRHPSGRAVEVKVVAGARAGASLVARWSAGAIFDEAPRMVGSDDGVVNFDDARRAVLGRLLPGAQVIAIGSPWAPFGPIYDTTQEHWGKPSRNLVVVRGNGPAMNPQHWTPARCEELRVRDQQAHRTDVLGEFADPETSLFTADDLERVTRPSPMELPREPGAIYYAAQDPATRSNAWTLVVAMHDGNRVRIACARQWLPRRDARLSPAAVLDEIAAVCAAYGVIEVASDAWSADALNDLARDRGIRIEARQRTTQERVELFESLRTLVLQETVELPPDADVRADLVSVRKRVTARAVSIELPRTGDGRHADFAPSVALVVKLAAAGSGFGAWDEFAESRYDEAIVGCWGDGRGDSFGDGGGRGGDSFG